MKWSDEFQRVCGIFGITYAAEVDNFPPVDRMELQSLKKMFMVTHLTARHIATWIATKSLTSVDGLEFLTQLGTSLHITYYVILDV